MEIVGSIASVVQVALFVAEKLLKREKMKVGSSEEENIKQLKFWLSGFQSFVRDNETGQQQTRVSQDVVEKVIDIIADIEDALDEFMFATPVHIHSNRYVQTVSNTKHSFTDVIPARKKLASSLQKIKKSIEEERVKELISEAGKSSHGRLMRNAYSLQIRCFQQMAGPSPSTTGRKELFEKGELVGFKTTREQLRLQLNGNPNQLERAVIQVTGSGGSGKTFLVQTVTEEVRNEFECYAFIDMALLVENWMEDLSKQTFSCYDRQSWQHEAGNDEQKLQRHLEGKRYLIVLDDVWEKENYAFIVNWLPNNWRGSRIIITTRNSGIADDPSYTHKLGGLIDEEAWELFCSRAFIDKVCAPGLKPISKKIIERCECMPLSVAAAGRLLSREAQVESTWEKFHDNLGSELGKISLIPIENLILQPSFVDLPDYLRSCFLYFSVFPENYSVSRGRLIRSWAAEGFMPETDKKTPEEVAGSCLAELVRRNLVRVCSSAVDGRVRSCRVLRLHHAFIVPLAEKGGFVTVIGSKSSPQSPAKKSHQRVSVQSDNFHTNLLNVGGDLRRLRTLFVFGKLEVPPESDSRRLRLKKKIKKMFSKDELEKLFAEFELLKVLDLQGVPLQQLPDDVGSFVLLRYLNLRHTELETIPSSIQNLGLLETLDLKHTRVKHLPKWIRKLQNLRHLVVLWVDLNSRIEQGVTVSSASIGAIPSLQRVSLIKASDRRRGFSIADFERLEQLKKLGLVDVDKTCAEKVCKTIEKMESLSKLDVRSALGNYLELDHMNNPPKNIRSLRLIGSLRNLPHWIPKLSSLVKVALKGSNLSNNPLDALEDLPSLMELEIVEYYTGKSLTFKDETFQNLKKLHVEQLSGLTDVTLERRALIKLECLTICKCQKLNPLPRIYPLGRLEDFVVYEMSDTFMADVDQRIREGDLVDRIEYRSSGEIRSRHPRFT